MPSPVKAITTCCIKRCPAAKKRAAREDGDWWWVGYAVKDCRHRACPLWPYREGHNPRRAGIGGRPRRAADAVV